MQKVGVIGGGAWGTALAIVMAQAGREVVLWTRESELVEEINAQHTNSLYLPDIALPENIEATKSLSQAADSDALLIVTPAQAVRQTLEILKSDIYAGKPVVICSKGIELDTGFLMSQIAKDIIPDISVALLSGPNFAREIASGLPAAATLAITDKDVAQELVDGLSSRNLRLYVQEDMIGAQIGGAVKNVIAIACGVVSGKDMGESARAALITRGMVEMARLASAMGARKETLLGMCGMGDLMLTCTSLLSRNYSLGYALGQGKTLDDILGARHSVTEGYHTAEALMTMARKNAVDMPICETVYAVLKNNLPVDVAIDRLLERPPVCVAERKETQ